MPRKVEFSPEAFDELKEWLQVDSKMVKKILDLIETCTRTPFEGIGKPEGLKGNLKGYWSRRINLEHQLVYRVTDERIYIFSCHGHYE